MELTFCATEDSDTMWEVEFHLYYISETTDEASHHEWRQPNQKMMTVSP